MLVELSWACFASFVLHAPQNYVQNGHWKNTGWIELKWTEKTLPYLDLLSLKSFSGGVQFMAKISQVSVCHNQSPKEYYQRCSARSSRSGCVTRDHSDCTCGLSHPCIWTHYISSIHRTRRKDGTPSGINNSFDPLDHYVPYVFLQCIKFRLLMPKFISKNEYFLFISHKLHSQCI